MSEDEEFKMAEELKCRIKSKKELDVLKILNEKIKRRTSYGGRSEISEDRGWVLMWSNAGRSWAPWRRIPRKGLEIVMDSNEILTPFTLKELEPILPCLATLPTYYQSTEAKERGEVDVLEATTKWLEKQFELAEKRRMQKELK